MTQDELKNTEWFDIIGYEGRYQINMQGDVLSLNYENRGYADVLSPAKNNKGYFFVRLTKDKKVRTELIHRLLAIAFVPNPEPEIYDEVNHIDEDHQNNALDNLEWTTHRKNLNHGTARIRSVTAHYKAVSQLDTTGKVIATYNSVKEAGIATNIHPSSISAVLCSRQTTAGGYKWEYVDKSVTEPIKKLYEQNPQFGDSEGTCYNNDNKIKEDK